MKKIFTILVLSFLIISAQTYPQGNSVKQDNTQLKSFTLNQNYPNPFNPTTQITYVLNEDAFVQLKVFNLIGKNVATLVNKDQPAGEHDVTFDGSDLTSGIYFVKLIVGKNSQTIKMTLLK